MGPQRAELLKKELGIFTFRDLLEYFPFRHIDRTTINRIIDIRPDTDFIQVSGIITSVEIVGDKRSRRLVATIRDNSGELELVWFQGISWIEKNVQVGGQYLVFGRTSFFQGSPQITHPDIEPMASTETKSFLEPVYGSTEKLKARSLGGRQIGKLTQALFLLISEADIPENLPVHLVKQMQLMPRYRAYCAIHFPPDNATWEEAIRRLKFEELFFAQLRLNIMKVERHRFSRGLSFPVVGELFKTFYEAHLPFQLTGAQKRVIREIRKDLGSGKQMNRLLQGDVGSGKTIVALLCMLLACDNSYQSCLMAPTEILAQQHYTSLTKLLAGLPVNVQILTGSSRSVHRKRVLKDLSEGVIQIVVGTHAIIEDAVVFQNLGLAIVDEQHRFGVAQRAKLWKKASLPPHMLVMTATPIPRTLAMTAYGDLDYSIIDELPPNRKPISTVHRYETVRSQVMGF
ncbi:MAG TPA: ATP-dependent DNA helicase RecG, partial [Flavitalea sp.]|nr:ATP-dependent DNA helicase RecG [Flavitalea sp.]